MNETGRKPPDKRLVIGVILYAVTFFIIIAVSNLQALNHWLARVLDIIFPVLLGLAIAYLINPIFRFFERRVFSRVSAVRMRRVLALLLTYLLLLAIIAGLILLIIPQLVSSVKTFAGNFNNHIDSLIVQLNGLIERLNQVLPARQDGSSALTLLDRDTVLSKVNGLWDSLVALLRDSMSNGGFSHIFEILSQTTSVITNTIFSIFISLYVLATKELRYAQVMKFRTGWFSNRTNSAVTRILSIADRSFGGFLRGKLLDSTIVGILVYLFCLIAKIQNPILIAVIVGVTDIIPVIGPFIGVIPSAVIILLTDPIKVILFLLAILVIQQIDGNIIAPKILGENTGVSSLCVLIAIILMGSLWGLVGMIIGVPLFATVLELLRIWIDRRLRQKGLSSEVTGYYAKDAIGGIPAPAKTKKEKKFLWLRRFPAGNTEHSPELDTLRLQTYAIAAQHHLFRHPTDAALDAFAAEEAVLLQKLTAQEAPEADGTPGEAEPAEPEVSVTDQSQSEERAGGVDYER